MLVIEITQWPPISVLDTIIRFTLSMVMPVLYYPINFYCIGHNKLFIQRVYGNNFFEAINSVPHLDDDSSSVIYLQFILQNRRI